MTTTAAMPSRTLSCSTAHRRRRARELADDFGGVLSRALLRTCDVDHELVRREIAAERWMAHGHQTVAMTTAPLGTTARRWHAVWETGLKVAALDGVSALHHAGLTGYDDEAVHVSVKHTAEVAALDGVRIHKVIRRVEHELFQAGISRTRPAVAAVRAAHWASTDRHAALLLVLPVQQRLCTGRQLIEAVEQIRGRNRRKLIHVVAGDVADGAHSLGELDVVAACRRRALQMVDDDLRHNQVQLGDELVLRVSLVGWRLMPDAYLDQICAAYWSRVGRRF